MTRGIRVVADLNWFGHIPTYHKLCARAFLELGYEVVSLSPNPAEVLAEKPLVAAAREGRLRVPLKPVGGERAGPTEVRRAMAKIPAGKMVWRMLRQWRWLRETQARTRWKKLNAVVGRELANDAKDDLLFLPYLDDLLHQPTARRTGQIRWAGIFLNSSELRRKVPKISNRGLRLFRDKELAYVGVLDEGAVDPMRRYCRAEIPVAPLPDLTDTSLEREETPLQLRIERKAKGRPIVALLGHLTPRKGLARFCSLVGTATGGKICFLLAGELEELQVPKKIVDFLKRAEAGLVENCYAHLGRIRTESEFNTLVALSSVLYLRYIDFPGSSNLLTKAAVFRRPVFVTAGGCMAERVTRHQMGSVIADESLDEEQALLANYCEGKVVVKDEGFASYLEVHSYRQFLGTIGEMESRWTR